jgi:hypothetical protein
VRRIIWLAAGAAAAAAVLVALPDLYARLREAVAGGPIADDDWADDPFGAPVAFAQEEPADSPPASPRMDSEADALRSRIGEGRERLRRKAVAATPDLTDDDDTETDEPA